MAKITCVESTTVTSQLIGPVSPLGHATDRLTFVVEYGEDFQVTIDMNALYQPLREALPQLGGLDATVATRLGWQYLGTYLNWAGHAPWTAAVRGFTERFEIQQVRLEYTPNPEAPWMIATADFQGTWSASLGIDLSVLSGTTAATLDGTLGMPGFIAPAVEAVGTHAIPLKGMACVGKRLDGAMWLPLVAFDASVAMDLERVYLAIAGMFCGETFTWQEFLDGWEALFRDAECTVQIRTGTYTLALVSSAQAYQEELRYYAQLSNYFRKQEEALQLQSAHTAWHTAMVT